mgnify:CR=1 FL=1
MMKFHLKSELWEILLRRKVELRGADIVFAEVMEKIPYSEQIKRQSFERWYAQNNDMILPRSRRMQDALFQYLSIATPYDKNYSAKESPKRNKNRTKRIRCLDHSFVTTCSQTIISKRSKG